MNAKVLYVSQEMMPYLPETPMGSLARKLPQQIQEMGNEIRTFMPKWGPINERRNQLHEVIRLSGMNLIINDSDHQLIIKVASIPSARMQVYFIDSEDFFLKRLMATDAKDVEYKDNGQRAIFYARGVIETVKKLRWNPDVVHCQGWISAVVPMFVKTVYGEDPAFRDSKVVYALYDEKLEGPMGEDFVDCLLFKTLKRELFDKYSKEFTFEDFNKMAIDFSDGLVCAAPHVDENLVAYARQRGIPVMEYPGDENYAEAYNTFYKSLLGDTQTSAPASED